MKTSSFTDLHQCSSRKGCHVSGSATCLIRTESDSLFWCCLLHRARQDRGRQQDYPTLRNSSPVSCMKLYARGRALLRVGKSWSYRCLGRFRCVQTNESPGQVYLEVASSALPQSTWSQFPLLTTTALAKHCRSVHSPRCLDTRVSVLGS